MKFKLGEYAFIVLLIGFSLTSCSGSPSILAPQGGEAVPIASLTWLMFGVAGIVLLIISAFLWMSYRRSRVQRKEKDFYANDHNYLRNVILGGGIAPIVILSVVMGLGVGIEN